MTGPFENRHERSGGFGTRLLGRKARGEAAREIEALLAGSTDIGQVTAGGDMVVKGGRFGAFLGCSNYPQCRNTRPLSIGMKCPLCKTGDVIERKTKRKRVFYGCSRYPDCDFASWDKPVAQACDTCGSPYLVLKYTQSRGEYLLCPSCKAEIEREEVQQAAG